MTNNTSVTLDWISFTLKDITHEAAKWISVYASPEKASPATPVQNYTDAYRAENGVLYCWNTHRAEMGNHIVISGSALRYIWEHNECDQRALVQAVCDFGGRVSRLDLAKDLQNVDVDFDQIYSRGEKGFYSGTARRIERHTSANNGYTIYVGSRESEKFIRIYNKAAESKLQGQLWARFEIETKGMVARALATMLSSTENWSGAFDDMARGMFKPDKCKSFDLFFEPGVIPIGLPKLEKNSDREKWIDQQVTPAIAKHFAEHLDSKAVAKLRELLDLIAQRQSTVDEFAKRDYTVDVT